MDKNNKIVYLYRHVGMLINVDRVHIEMEIRGMDEKGQTSLTNEHESYVITGRGYYSNYAHATVSEWRILRCSRSHFPHYALYFCAFICYFSYFSLG